MHRRPKDQMFGSPFMTNISADVDVRSRTSGRLSRRRGVHTHVMSCVLSLPAMVVSPMISSQDPPSTAQRLDLKDELLSASRSRRLSPAGLSGARYSLYPKRHLRRARGPHVLREMNRERRLPFAPNRCSTNPILESWNRAASISVRIRAHVGLDLREDHTDIVCEGAHLRRRTEPNSSRCRYS